MKKLVLVGCGGHFKSVYDCINRDMYSEIVVLDDHVQALPEFDVTIGGPVEQLAAWRDQGFTHLHVCIGNLAVRQPLLARARELGYQFETIIAASAVVSSGAFVEEGVFVGKRVVVNIDARIGANSILNTGCIVEHDCVIGKNVHLAPAVTLTGAVQIGANTMVGAGSVVLPNQRIGANSIIGAGSTVVHEIEDGVVAYGTPCEVRRHV